MIRLFGAESTRRVFAQETARGIPADIVRVAQRKLNQIHFAGELLDLRVPPGNRLEALTGNRAGQHSIRINDQWRICFIWSNGGADDVEIVDYHR